MSWHIRAQLVQLDDKTGALVGTPLDTALLLNVDTKAVALRRWEAFCLFCDNFGILKHLNWPPG